MTAVRFAWERRLYKARDPRITTGTVAVGAALANYADLSGVCYPGTELLAHDARMSIRSARTHLTRLESMGAIRRLTMGSKNTGTSRWQLIAPTEWPQTEATDLLSATASGGSHRPAETPQGETIDSSGGSHSPANRPRTDHYVVVVSLEGDDDQTDDSRAGILSRIEQALDLEELKAIFFDQQSLIGGDAGLTAALQQRKKDLAEMPAWLL